jgi:transposase
VRELRPSRPAGFEVRFETPAGEQAQVDFARFEVEFVDELGVKRIIRPFSMVLGYSRLNPGASLSIRTANSSSLS